MITEANRSAGSRGRYAAYTRRAGAGLALALVVVSASAVPTRATSQADFDLQASVHNVILVEKETMFSASGKPAVRTTRYWQKADQVRMDVNGQVTIWNGEWKFTDYYNHYTRQRSTTGSWYTTLVSHVVPGLLVRDYREKGYQVCQIKAIKDVTYPALLCLRSGAQLQEREVVMLYLDPVTQFLKAETAQRWDKDGKLAYEKEASYEYKDLDLPDSLFQLQPPEGATVEEVQGTKKR